VAFNSEPVWETRSSSADDDAFGERIGGVAGEEKVSEMAIGLTELDSGIEEVLPMLKCFRLRIVRSFGEKAGNEEVPRDSS
jgi:hypothetical protein